MQVRQEPEENRVLLADKERRELLEEKDNVEVEVSVAPLESGELMVCKDLLEK